MIDKCTTGALGYDLVAYHTVGRPVRGSGNHTSEVDGIVYLFSSEDNKSAFDENSLKYIPAFGGYCAYGAAVSKKFVGDPEVWEIVDNKLYLNLNIDIQSEWKKDIPGNIVKANQSWSNIKDRSPAEL